MEEFSSADIPAGIAINAHIAGRRANLPVHASQQEEAKGAVPSDVANFKDLLDFCIQLFQDLIEELLQASKLSEYYFLPIIRRIDDELVRLEIWASDIGVKDPKFGRSSKVATSTLEVTVYMIGILESIITRLHGVGKIVGDMRDSLKRLSSNSSADPKRTRYLDKLSKSIEVEHQLIVAAIRRLVDLTKAFKMELANRLQSGPLVERRAHILKMREDVLRKVKPQSTTTTERSSLSSQGDPEPSALDRDARDTEQQDPWRNPCLLSFDDGGTKSYASLLLLKALMEEIAALEQGTASSSADPLPLEPGNWRRQHAAIPGERGDLAARFLPCHYFDYIAGASFGGIIAIMLGRLRMTVNECMEAYVTLLDEVWSHPRKTHILGPGQAFLSSRGKYDHERMSDSLKKIVEDSKLGTTYPQLNEDMCRTIVTVLSNPWSKPVARIGESYLFRSYNHTEPAGGEGGNFIRNLDPPDDYPIWQVGRAATAGTGCFARMKPEEMGYNKNELSAFTSYYNPTLQAFYGSFPHKTINYDAKIAARIVSIGSGQSGREGPFFTKSKLFRTKGRPLHDRTHDNMITIKMVSALRYFRLDFEDTLIRKMSLDTWKGERGSKTLGLIREKVEAYLSSPDARALISDAAGELVTIRQARSKWEPDLDRWKRFCLGVEYNCPVSQCKQNTRKFVERRELQRHLERVHRSDPQMMETLLNKGERYPLYDQATTPLS